MVARAGLGVRGLVPRGTLFERAMSCTAQPMRNGVYEFCVVGLDAKPGHVRYLAWVPWRWKEVAARAQEPTGYFDPWFSCDEVELRLALRKVHQEPRRVWPFRWCARSLGARWNAGPTWRILRSPWSTVVGCPSWT